MATATTESKLAAPQPVRYRALRRGVTNNAIRIVVAAFSILVWEFAVRWHLVGSFAVSTPTAVLAQLVSLGKGGDLGAGVSATLLETSLGLVFGVVVGVLVGFLLSVFSRAGEVLEPFITMLNSLPRFALAPLYLLWFGIGTGSKVALVFSLVVFVLVINTIEGARTVDQDIVSMSRVMGADSLQILQKVVLPTTFPWIVAGIRLSIAYALAGAVVGEMFSSQQGIGYLITAGSGVFNIAQIFASLVTIMVIAWGIDQLARIAERRILHWRPQVPLG